MNKELEELRRIELEQAAERLRTAIRRMRDDGPSSRDVRIEPKVQPCTLCTGVIAVVSVDRVMTYRIITYV